MWSGVNSFSIVHCLNNCLIQQNCNYSWNFAPCPLPTFLSPCPVWSECFELSHSGISGSLPLITYNFMEVRKNCVWWREGDFWKGAGKSSKMWSSYDSSLFSTSIPLTKLCPNHWKPSQTPAYFSAILKAIKNNLHSHGEALAFFKVEFEPVEHWQLFSWKLLMESTIDTGSREM